MWLRSRHVQLWRTLTLHSAFFEYPLKWCAYSAVWLLHGWCHVKLLSSRRTFCVHHTTMHHGLQCHFIQSHVWRVRACSAVTSHLHFGQNDRDLLRATAVTRGWNGYRNASQHRKLTLDKTILPPLLPGLEPGTFRSRVRRSNHWAILAPRLYVIRLYVKHHVLVIITYVCMSTIMYLLHTYVCQSLCTYHYTCLYVNHHVIIITRVYQPSCTYYTRDCTSTIMYLVHVSVCQP